MPDGKRLIAALRNPRVYGEHCLATTLLETHISWVILTGEFAYKIKKPVDFGFLDFSTLAKRHFYCQEELRLNRRLAARLYMDVIPITGTDERPHLGGAGPALEYAVRLRQFDESQLGDQLALGGKLKGSFLDDLAITLAQFHQMAPRSDEKDSHGLPDMVTAAAEHNFIHLAIPAGPEARERLERLRNWTLTKAQALASVFLQRKQAGYIRECHGDLHLGNLVLLEGRLVPFDCIEFSEDLRWIDVISEIAFLVMDLEVRSGTAHAFRLFNRYLEITGDYGGLALLDYYRVYRAMVRAKIASLSLVHCAAGPSEQADLVRLMDAYLNYADCAIQPRKPALIITHGYSGSGKSHLSRQLAETLPAIRLSSDVERKRLAGLTAEFRTGSGALQGIYSQAFTEETYRHLLDTARGLLQAGFSVIVDATFLIAPHRQAQRQLAAECNSDFVILDLRAEERVLRQRVESRLREGSDPSEADVDILQRQMQYAEGLSAEEQTCAWVLDAEKPVEIQKLLATIKNRSRPSA